MKKFIIETLNNIPAPIAGAMMSIVISILRIIYDNEETKIIRILLESCICGALTLTVGAGIKAGGLDPNWVMFTGGVIGYLGSAKIRSISLKIINKKIK